MAKSYLESTEEGKAAQFIKFKNHIGDYAELLGFPKVNNLLNPDLQQQAKDADYYDWVVKQVGAGRDYAKAITAWRDAALLSRGRGVGQPPRNALRVVECGGKRRATPLWLGARTRPREEHQVTAPPETTAPSPLHSAGALQKLLPRLLSVAG